MTGASVLFIGGSGVISAACVREAVQQGFDVHVVNRGKTDARPLPETVTRLQADSTDRDALAAAVGDRVWDVVVNWIAFTPEQVQADIDLFAGRARQYIFISSATFIILFPFTPCFVITSCDLPCMYRRCVRVAFFLIVTSCMKYDTPPTSEPRVFLRLRGFGMELSTLFWSWSGFD